MIKGCLGAKNDIEYLVDKLAPINIFGLSKVSLTDSFNKTRWVVSLGFRWIMKPNHSLLAILQ